MASYLRKNTAVRICVGPFLDKTDGITPETAITVTGCHLTGILEDDDNTECNLIIDVDLTASGGDNDMIHITNDDAGYYDLELTAAQTNYNGRLKLSINNVGVHCPVFHEFIILPQQVYDSMISGSDLLDCNASQLGGTSQTGRDVGASVLLSSGTGTGQLDFTSGVVNSNLVQILATALTETSGYIAAAFKKFFNVATPTGTVNSIPDAVAGATNGLAIVGSAMTADVTKWNGTAVATPDTAGIPKVNMQEIAGGDVEGNNATLFLKALNVQNSSGTAVVFKSNGGNGIGLDIAGNGTADGLYVQAGMTSGNAIVANSPNGNGIKAYSSGDGCGIYVQGNLGYAGMQIVGGGTGIGLHILGGSTSGDAVVFAAAADGKGLSVTGAKDKVGISVVGGSGTTGSGATGRGIEVTGGSNGTAASDGVLFKAGSYAGTARHGLQLLGNATGKALVADTFLTDINTELETTAGHGSGSWQTGGGGGPSVADIADGVWDEARSGHVNQDSFGAALYCVRSGTAQAGSTDETIVLDASASSVNEYYDGMIVEIVGGTGAGQSRIIKGYTGLTKVAVIGQGAGNPIGHSKWETTPDNTSKWVIHGKAQADLHQIDRRDCTESGTQDGTVLKLQHMDIINPTGGKALIIKSLGDDDAIEIGCTTGNNDAITITPSGTGKAINYNGTELLSAINTYLETTAGHLSGSWRTGGGSSDVNVVSISGDAAAADALEAMLDGTGAPVTFKASGATPAMNVLHEGTNEVGINVLGSSSSGTAIYAFGGTYGIDVTGTYAGIKSHGGLDGIISTGYTGSGIVAEGNASQPDIDAKELATIGGDLTTVEGKIDVIDTNVDTIVAKLPSGDISDLSMTSTTDDGIQLQQALNLTSAVANGAFALDTPSANRVTLYKRNGTTPLSVLKVDATGRTRIS